MFYTHKIIVELGWIREMKKFVLVSLIGILSSSSVFAADEMLFCDGKVTKILTGNPYCASGARIGFQWEASTKWLCSNNKNMDAMLMTAYAAGVTISVRDFWASCESPQNGESPNHIWFK